MSNDKEIRIRAILDSSTFDKGISEISEKLRKITQQQTQGAGTQRVLGKDTVMGKYAQQAFGDFSKESQKQLEQMYRVQRQEAVNQQVTMKGKQQELEKMVKIDGNLTKQQKERVELLKKEIDLLKEKHRQTLTTAGETQKALDKMKPDLATGAAGGGAGGPPTGGGESLAGGAGRMFSGLLKGMTAAALIRGGFNAATQAYSDFMVTRPREMEAAKGQAMTGISRDMRENYSGKGSNRAFWAQERSQAFRMAKTERDRQENLDLVRGGVGTAVGAAGGAYAGMMGGAALGTMIMPGIGTAVGAVGGALIGGAAGGYGGAGLMGGEGGRAAIFDQEKYKNMSTAQMLKNREAIEASLMAQDPRRAHARDYFTNNYQNMSSFERMTGRRGQQEMYGGAGLLRTQMRMGEQYGGGMLSMEDIQNQTGALYGAGAGTGGAEMSGMAAAINRQLGTKNAAQTMGRLQGMGGLGNEGTQDATKRLLAEAVRLGVDTSKMPQEMERMTAMTAQIATAGGGFSTIAAQVAGAGVAGLSSGQIAAAGTAYQGFESRAGESSGIGGQIGFGFMLGEKGERAFGKEAIGKIRKNPRLMNQLNMMSAADLQKNTSVLKGMARDLGMDPNDLLRAKQEMDVDKQIYNQPEEDISKELGALTKGMSGSDIDKLKSGTGKKTEKYEDVQYRLSQMRMGSMGKEYKNKGAFGMEAENLMISRGGEGLSELGGFVGLNAAMGAPIQSAAEKERSSAARGQSDMLYNLNQNIEDFGKAADASVKNADAINFAMNKLSTALDKGGDKVTDNLKDIGDQLAEFSKRMERAGIPATKVK